jgi:hypothetical protein
MKKIMSIWFILFFTIVGNAQINNKTNLSELNKDQLKLALKKSSENMLFGQIMIGLGIGLIMPGVVMILDGQRYNGIAPGTETVRGLGFLGTGFLFELVSIPTTITSSNRKTNIEIELAKFNMKGSASLNGIGFKIRF